MSVEYEGTIGGYSFILKEDNVIEVWDSMDEEYPKSFIYLKAGDIVNKKAFDVEISHWAICNGVV